MQQQYQFNQRDLGHGADASLLHPVVAVALLISIIIMLWRPRKSMIVPFMLCVFLIPRGEVIVVAGFHFYTRIVLIFVGFARIVLSKLKISGGFNKIDSIFVAWILYRTFAMTVTNWPGGTAEQCYFLLQGLCGYFLLRALIREEADITRTAKVLAVIAAILGGTMVYEHIFKINLFGTFIGGGPAVPDIRNDAGRAQATFGHSILAGSFGATIIPLFIWLWTVRGKFFAMVGIIGSTLMVLAATSSTPVMAYMAGVGGILLWPVRGSVRFLRWGLVFTIICLAIVMKAPVWYVIAHIDVVSGSGGYDRAQLIDTCVRHFADWWLIGTNQNGNWGYDMWDLSDQFVAEAEMGGLFTLICFIAIITGCFSRLGKMKKVVERNEQWLPWCLGCVMFANIFAFFGVAYWDQTQIWWFALLAMISAATIPTQSSPVEDAAPATTTSRFGQYHAAAETRGWPQLSAKNKSMY